MTDNLEDFQFTATDIKILAIQMQRAHDQELVLVSKAIKARERWHKYRVLFLLLSIALFVPSDVTRIYWWFAPLIGFATTFSVYLIDRTIDNIIIWFIDRKIKKIFKDKLKGKENNDAARNSSFEESSQASKEGTEKSKEDPPV